MKRTGLADLNIYDVGVNIHMVGAVYQNKDHTYLCMLPDDKIEGELVELEMDVSDWETFVRQSDLLEVEVFQKASNGKLAKVVVRKSARQVNLNVSWECFRRDNYACRYCGRKDAPLTADHLVTFDEGGPWTRENILTACKKCNKKRGNMPFANWLVSSIYIEAAAGERGGPGISEEISRANAKIATTLDKIPRMKHKPTRGKKKGPS